MDKRNEKSKEAIRQALIRLSRSKPYSEISVRELCREAHVSRSTFYNNYRFFNDVVADMSESYMKKLREKKLTRAFFDSLQHDSDELNLLLESGVFGRDFCLYLRNLKKKPPNSGTSPNAPFADIASRERSRARSTPGTSG